MFSGVVDRLNEGWIFTLLSTCLCVLGCFIIYIDDLYSLLLPRYITKRYKFELRENYAFMNASLLFSSGCLIFTALYRLLPEGKSYMNKACSDGDETKKCSNAQSLLTYLFVSYTGGMIVCLSLNAVLHLITSKSVVHCKHSGDEESHEYEAETSIHHSHSHLGNRGGQDSTAPNGQAHFHAHTHSNGNHAEGEDTPLIPKIRRTKSLLHYITNTDDVGECKGYASADVYLFHNGNHDEDNNATALIQCPIDLEHSTIKSISDRHILSEHHHRHNAAADTDAADSDETILDHTEHSNAHHHHVSTPLSHLLLIGIQTTLAITLHKLPEGFITYVTSETNKKLGVLIFISLMLHNFTEGFLMCLPLYYLMSASPSPKYAKLKAFSISAILGGISQPLGALCGAGFLKYNRKEDIDLDQLNFIFGVTMAITSGFLTVVGLQMFSSAILFNRGSLNFVLLWCLTGISLIGFSSVLTAKIN